MAKRITEEMMIKADGQRIGGDSDYWVYLTNLNAYNEGALLGTYLHFPFDRDDLNQAFQQIYVGSEFVDEFGLNAIKHTILHEYVDLQSAQNKELEYRPNAKIGWNITKGGGITPDCTGRKHSPETIAKITSKNKETKSQRKYVSHFKGKTGRWSDEQKQKIGSYHKGKTISKAHKQAVKDKNSGFNNSKSNKMYKYSVFYPKTV